MKHTFTLAALVFATACFGQVPDYVPTDGLVAWWDMNGDGEDSGPLQINPVNTGYLSGIDRFGNATGAFNSNDTHINYGVHPEIQNESFSFAAWINPTTPSGEKVVMGYHNDVDGGATLGLFPDNRVKLHTNNWLYDGFASSEPLVLGAWAHLVGTYSQGVLSLYIDGQLDIELEGIESPNSNNENFEVGRWTGGATQYFNGLIDDVGVWDRRLDVGEIIGLFNAEAPVYGCVDIASCNFNPAANVGDGSCEYGCLSCGPGTVWDESIQLCVGANPSDSDFDGCVGMTDLLDLLSVFGTCNETPWSCGDLLEYQGYDYETVQIGQQCWFAENLRSENYRNGEAILGDLSNEEWVDASNSMIGAQAFFDNNDLLLLQYGRLYNQYAVNDERALCPLGWHVPSDGEFMTLELELGMSEDEVVLGGWRGTDQGDQMKSSSEDVPSWDGTNSSGFAAVPGGNRRSNGGSFHDLVATGYLWTSSSNLSRRHFSDVAGVSRYSKDAGYGFSIRCIQDSE